MSSFTKPNGDSKAKEEKNFSRREGEAEGIGIWNGQKTVGEWIAEEEAAGETTAAGE